MTKTNTARRSARTEVVDAAHAPTLNAAGIASPMMASAAIAEIAERQAEDQDSVAAHVKRLNGGVSLREYEKALHTIASFHTLLVEGIDRKTGEITKWNASRSEAEQVLNAVCYAHARLLNPLDEDFSSVGKLAKAKDLLDRDVRALTDGGEISEQELERSMQRVDLRETIVAAVKEGQAVAERVYKVRCEKDFKRPDFKVRVKAAKVTDADAKARLIAEASKRTGKTYAAPTGDAPFDMAKDSADPSMR